MEKWKNKARGTSWHGARLPSLAYQMVGRKQKQEGVPAGRQQVSRFKKKLFQIPRDRICPWKRKMAQSGDGGGTYFSHSLAQTQSPSPPHTPKSLFLRSPSWPGSVYSGGHPTLLPTSLGLWASAVRQGHWASTFCFAFLPLENREISTSL